MTSMHMEIPDLRTVLRHAAPRFIEGTLMPLVLFLVGLKVLGVWGAMAAGLVWVYAAIIVARRHPPQSARHLDARCDHASLPVP